MYKVTTIVEQTVKTREQLEDGKQLLSNFIDWFTEKYAAGEERQYQKGAVAADITKNANCYNKEELIVKFSDFQLDVTANKRLTETKVATKEAVQQCEKCGADIKEGNMRFCNNCISETSASDFIKWLLEYRGGIEEFLDIEDDIKELTKKYELEKLQIDADIE